VEFALLAAVIFFVTFAVLEGSMAAWQWNAVEKAAQTGVRQAVVSEPVAGSVKLWDCNSGSMPGGAPCTDSPTTFPTVTCTSTSCTDGTHDAVAFAAIRNAIGAGYPFINDRNIIIEYRDSKLGFVARPSGVIPIVEVTLTGVPYNFIVLDVLGLLIFGDATIPDQITMPDVTATLSGEDMTFKF
jgi:hypothetical protein